MKKEEPKNPIASLLEILLVIFIVLKLLKLISWSWWWVTSPFWIPLGLAAILYTVIISVKMVGKAKDKKKYNRFMEEINKDEE